MKCRWCAAGDHEECIDHGSWNGADISEAVDPMCDCNEGDCEEQVSYACAEWLHNCPGCPCSCHDDPKARAIWTEAWNIVTSRSRRQP